MLVWFTQCNEIILPEMERMAQLKQLFVQRNQSFRNSYFKTENHENVFRRVLLYMRL